MEGFGIPNPISGVLFGGEDQAHKFIVAEQSGAAFAGTVSAKFLRYADDQTVPLTGSIEDGKTTVTLIENCYYLPGRFKLTIYVTAGGSTTAVYCCMGTVDRTDGRTTVDPSGEINLDVTDLINRINAAVGSIPPEYTALLNTIAPNFSTSTAYAAGQYVWNGGTLYRFTADHAAGAWIGTDATAAVIGEELAEIKGDVAQLSGVYNYYDPKGTYTQTNKDGSARSGYTINADGSISLTRSIAEYGQVYLVADSQTIGPGKYIISGKMTLTGTTPDNNWIYTGVGRNVTRIPVQMTTTRDGDTIVDVGSKTGWFRAVFELSTAEAFAFECVPSAVSMVDASHPCKIEYLMIVEGDTLPAYSPNTMTAQDKIARQYIAGLDASVGVLEPAATASDISKALKVKSVANDKVSEYEFGDLVAIDDTLTVAGAAADAEATGDKIDELRSRGLADPEITWIEDYYVDYRTAAPVANTNYRYAKIPVAIFRGGNISGVTGIAPNTMQGVAFVDYAGKYISGVRHTTAETYRFPYDLTVPNNAAHVLITLRKASESVWVAPTYPWAVVTGNLDGAVADDDADEAVFNVNQKLKNARHIRGGSSTPLTLLHFSDLHSDTAALARIMAQAYQMGANIDDRICTGDIVSNTYGEIASWWDPTVMTCIGNHETASYNASTGYDWTALSMADRDAYYIAPFESGWGITHSAGTSYYYKDYTTQKIRLIVMDVMLYSGTPGAEAAAQTTWLSGLLSDSITNDLHVLIAIHAPHGGATPIDCSFSKFGQGTMPTRAECNTPSTVTDAVAAAITNGLHFIGYIVGHTHQDNMWDATGDGSQLMYCVTCAAVSYAPQWQNSDQHRDTETDAYNLVTIDTASTLVKIVRGGGADIDDHMRTRQAICFNYSTGEMVGEVL